MALLVRCLGCILACFFSITAYAGTQVVGHPESCVTEEPAYIQPLNACKVIAHSVCNNDPNCGIYTWPASCQIKYNETIIFSKPYENCNTTPDPTPTPSPTPTPVDCYKKQGQNAGTYSFKSASLSGDPERCQSGCGVYPNGAVNCSKYLDGSGYYCTANSAVYSGKACSPNASNTPDYAATPTPVPPPGTTPPPGPTPKPTPTEYGCTSQGQGFVSYGGASRCVPANPDNPVSEVTQTTTTTLNPDGSTTTTTTTTTTTENGGTTTTSTSSSSSTKGGQCGEEGCNSSEEGTKEQATTEYCRENPNSEICKKQNDASVSGSCEAFSCKSEDPVQCEIAKVNWKQYCQAEEDSKKIQQESLYNDGKSVTDGTEWSEIRSQVLGDDGEGIDMSNMIKTDQWLSRSCPRDVNVTVLGRAIKIEISKVCAPLQMAGDLFVAGAWVIAALIVFRG